MDGVSRYNANGHLRRGRFRIAEPGTPRLARPSVFPCDSVLEGLRTPAEEESAFARKQSSVHLRRDETRRLADSRSESKVRQFARRASAPVASADSFAKYSEPYGKTQCFWQMAEPRNSCCPEPLFTRHHHGFFRARGKCSTNARRLINKHREPAVYARHSPHPRKADGIQTDQVRSRAIRPDQDKGRPGLEHQHLNWIVNAPFNAADPRGGGMEDDFRRPLARFGAQHEFFLAGTI
jgi:hypothetical protein